jgi:hypothetical protein
VKNGVYGWTTIARKTMKKASGRRKMPCGIPCGVSGIFTLFVTEFNTLPFAAVIFGNINDKMVLNPTVK